MRMKEQVVHQVKREFQMALIGLALLVGTAPLYASPPAADPGSSASSPVFSADMSARASELLTAVRSETAQLEPITGEFRTYARVPGSSWQTHASYLDRIKMRVNRLGMHIDELQKIRHAVQPWQQQAITEVTSHAIQVASSTEAAIAHLNENQDRLFVPEYRDYLTTIASSTEKMQETVNRFLEYEKTQQKLQRLETELELAKG